MSIQHFTIDQQGSGQFNNGEIIENKPIGFPQDDGPLKPYSSLFYWAKATALQDSTIGLHPHQGFEIMSFVLEGRIRHYDTQSKEWMPLDRGDVQIIRSRKGISHAEHMEAGSVMFQIWFDPNLQATLPQEASYSDYRADSFQEENGKTIYRNEEEGQVKMDAPEVNIWRQQFSTGSSELSLKKESI